MSPRERRNLMITLAVLLVLGAAAGFLMPRLGETPWQTIAADILFIQATLILVWGLIRLLGNMRAFTSVSYSFRRFHELLRGKQMKSSAMKDDYLTYRQNRPYHSDALPLLIIGAALVIISTAFSFSLVL